jgi:prepilin-type N-terminal cleavage/methylation domain-containing protein
MHVDEVKGQRSPAFEATARRQVRNRDGFTLAEMLVATVVLVMIVFFVTRLVNQAATIVTQGTKHMDTESQVRPFFDRLAVDIDQMVKRTDVSYFLKNATTNGDLNDRMAFFSSAPGYYDENGGMGYNSRYSLVAYRVNANSASASYQKVERMAKGLALNAAYTTPPSGTSSNNDVTPLLFLDSGYNTTIDKIWPAAIDPTADPADPYQKCELIGPQVFRFEYYYLTKLNPTLVKYPSGAQLTQPSLDWSNANKIDIADIAAIVVAVAAIDPQSRKLLTEANVQGIADALPNFTSGTPGALLAQWQNVLQTDAQITSLPRPALQGIRLYERYFYLNQ